MTELKDLARDLDRFRLRILAAALFVLFGFGLLAARLVYLQVVRHDELRRRPRRTARPSCRSCRTAAESSTATAVVLANNYTAYTLEITPSKARDLEATITALSELVEIRPSDRRRFAAARGKQELRVAPIRNRLSDTEMARFIAQRFRFPGVDIKARLFRNYPLGKAAAT